MTGGRPLLLGLLLLACCASGLAQRDALPAGYRLADPTGPCNCTDTPDTNDPVCGADLVTYGNECVAQCANVLVLEEKGPCPVCDIAPGDCQCGDGEYAPVCAFGLTWTDTCDADCGGYSCPQTPGVCTYHPGRTFDVTGPAASAAGGVAAAAAKTALPAVTSAKYDYTEAVHKTLLFYESMQSGVLDRQRLAWRGDSCQDCVGPDGEDVSGGFYEAGGSFLKLGLVEAFLVTMLGWSVDAFPEGFDKAANLENALAMTKWGADYLVAAHPAPNRFVAVVGNSTRDFAYYGPVEEYQDYVSSRPACYIDADNPGSEIAGEAAAGLAAAYIVLTAHGNGTFDAYLEHAEQLYEFASGSPGSYQDLTDPCLAQHGELYKSTGFEDELAWAAAWLYKATDKASYLAAAKRYYGGLTQPGYSFETGEKLPGLNVLMAEIDPDNAATYNENAQGFFRLYLEQIIPHTPRGLAYPYHWGALRPATQAAMLALIQSKQLRAANADDPYAGQLFNYAKYQIDYVLGDSGRSWLVGYGEDYPTYLWHKLSYNSYIDWPMRGKTIFANWTAQQTTGKFKTLLTAQASKFDMEGSFEPQRFIAYGALYGAPMKDDNMPSSRKDYTYAESTTDGVSGFAGAVAGLAEYFTTKQGPQDDCELDLGWTHPNATLTEKAINNTAVCSGEPPQRPVRRPSPSAVTSATPPKAATPAKPNRPRPTRGLRSSGGNVSDGASEPPSPEGEAPPATPRRPARRRPTAANTTDSSAVDAPPGEADAPLDPAVTGDGAADGDTSSGSTSGGSSSDSAAGAAAGAGSLDTAPGEAPAPQAATRTRSGGLAAAIGAACLLLATL